MFSFNHEAFLAAYQRGFPAPDLTSEAQAGLRQLLGSLAQDPHVTDVRWAAYMLATVKHECAGTWQPIEEYGKGRNRPYGNPVTVTDADGTRYTRVFHGRGYVQLTWQANYARLSRAIGMGNTLVIHPEYALQPGIAYAIMSYGMLNGAFTGVALAHFIRHDVCDYYNARRIINALDQAQRIQGYAQALESMLRESLAQPMSSAPLPHEELTSSLQ